MEKDLAEITDDVMGCDPNNFDPDHELTISARDLKEMLEEAYLAGGRAARRESY